MGVVDLWHVAFTHQYWVTVKEAFQGLFFQHLVL